MVFFEERFLPLVLVVGVGGHAEADFAKYPERFRDWSARKQRVLILSDPRAQEVPNAYWRKRFAELADSLRTTMPNVSCANAACLGSSLAVGAARAVSWLVKRGDDTYYCSSAVDGLAYLTRKGDELGLRIPADARDLAVALDACARRGGNPSTLVSENVSR